MKVTEPIDVYLADKLFQLTGQRPARERAPTRRYREALEGKTMVVFGGSYGIGADIAELGRVSYGANVATFSRSTTADPRRSAARTSSRRPRRRGRAVRLGRLRGQHRRGAPARAP